MNILIYIFAAIGAAVVALVLLAVAGWFFALWVARAELRRRARQAALTPPPTS